MTPIALVFAAPLIHENDFRNLIGNLGRLCQEFDESSRVAYGHRQL